MTSARHFQHEVEVFEVHFSSGGPLSARYVVRLLLHVMCYPVLRGGVGLFVLQLRSLLEL
jgi:hypothetical protein